MYKLALLAFLVASASGFSPAVPAMRLRSSKSSAMSLHMSKSGSSPNAMSKAALATLVAGSLMAGSPMLPADASINSQMAMDSNSFSVLSDNQKVYKQTARGVNPYAPEEEQMRQLERIARLEECEQRGSSMSMCEAQENQRNVNESKEASVKRRSPLTFAIPVLVTTAISGVLIKILNK